MSERRKIAIVALLLALSTCGVFARALSNNFIERYDDAKYVTQNGIVQEGITWRGLKHAFTRECEANWHPLTMLSHMLDCELYGLHPVGHHLTSVLLHAANAVLLFIVLHRMTGACWPSAFVAALFALHPLHVQSVAHVAQRKDVLSTLFWLLAMWAYVRYCTHPSSRPYVWVMLFLLLGLLAKPMLVSLPIVLLLMDYWPLKRFSLKGGSATQAIRHSWPYVREKLPLCALVVVSCVITFVVQSSAGAVSTFADKPLSARMANAAVSYVAYIRMMLWPSGIAAHYPYPSRFPVWKVVGAALLLVVLTWLTLFRLRNRPYCAIGWLWYVVTLIPVIGLIQVGSQAMADRYTYIPLVGLFIIAAWGGADTALHRPRTHKVLRTAATAAITACAASTWVHLGYWRDSETLWRRALVVTTDNDVAHLHLGTTLMLKNRLSEAEDQFKKVLSLMPSNPSAHYNLGLLYLEQGKVEEAESYFARVQPQSAELHALVGRAYFWKGHLDMAAQHSRESIRLDPSNATAHFTCGMICEREGRPDEAIGYYREAFQLDPSLGDMESLIARIRAGHGAASKSDKPAGS